MALYLTLAAAPISFLIGFVTARLLRIGGFVCIVVGLLAVAGGAWVAGVDPMPGFLQVVLILVVLQAGYLGGAIFFAQTDAAADDRSSRAPDTERGTTLKADQRR